MTLSLRQNCYLYALLTPFYFVTACVLYWFVGNLFPDTTFVIVEDAEKIQTVRPGEDAEIRFIVRDTKSCEISVKVVFVPEISPSISIVVDDINTRTDKIAQEQLLVRSFRVPKFVSPGQYKVVFRRAAICNPLDMLFPRLQSIEVTKIKVVEEP